jgi:hypothetical protein
MVVIPWMEGRSGSLSNSSKEAMKMVAMSLSGPHTALSSHLANEVEG